MGKFKTSLNELIKELYPTVYTDYRNYIFNTSRYERLGNVIITEVTEDLFVANILGHYSYADTIEKDVHEYNLIQKALEVVAVFAKDHAYDSKEVYYTERLGCKLGIYDGFESIENKASELGFTKLDV